jgi:hypothetical protein
MVFGMLLPAAPPRARARSTVLLVAMVLLVAALTPGTSGAQVPEETRSQAKSSGPAARFSVATLNLRKGMRVPGMRHDIGRVIGGGASLIGFQERLFSRPALRASLPKSWSLLMPDGPTGTDDNPIAFDKDVWKLQRTWPVLLTGKTWRRNTGRTAHDQYGVVAVLRHRASGHVIRSVSFHLPNHLHNRSTGGPNFANRGGVEAMWRMAHRVRRLEETAPEGHQLVAMCDCNVTADRDTTNLLLKGRIIKPLRLKSNYAVKGRGPGSGIDYVLAEQGEAFRLASYQSYTDLATDHPGVVASFVRRR